MESWGITFLFLLFAKVLALGASSSQHHNDHFRQCLTSEFETSNADPANVVYSPQNASYASLLQSPFLVRESASLKPLLIITPFHKHEIQAVIYCSKKLGTQIRVRSGGHDYEGLSYTSGIPFVVLDMRNFRSVSINTEEKTAWVEVGATLGQLYYTIARHSRTLAFPAGVCPTVGVGGHISGGGHGMIARKHSIAADHVIDAKLITADGQILDRKSMDEDLFWAIRGGGDKWQYVSHKIDDNLTMRLFLTSQRSPIHGNRIIYCSFTSLYLGRAHDLLAVMGENFPELGLVEEDCTEMSWIESVLYLAGLSDEPLSILQSRTPASVLGKIYFKGKSDFVREPIPVSGLRDIWRFLHEEDELVAQLEVTPWGGALNTYSESELPFAHRAGNILMIHYGVFWYGAENSELERHMDWMRRLYSYMAPYVSKNPRAAFINYRDLELGMNNQGNTSYAQASVWGRKYFGNNFDRLVRVKTKADPSNFFRNEQSIPPLYSPPLTIRPYSSVKVASS
ncbi:Berberine bridge enzyme-like 18 [Sesamum angolense]|uniref:Berberine bridge enzyme-like 18 n=1 Tax=Sesamum angolense TaxID=2727404 RepID=A0AAE2BVM3_9LAMI|nr:Berberine bridge enzyme-like 18 [Sesamum angolense]